MDSLSDNSSGMLSGHRTRQRNPPNIRTLAVSHGGLTAISSTFSDKL